MCVERNKNGVPQSNTKDLKCNLPLYIRVVASMHVRSYACMYIHTVSTSPISRPFVLSPTAWGRGYLHRTYLTDTQAIRAMHARTKLRSSKHAWLAVNSAEHIRMYVHTSGVGIWF